MAVIKSGNSTSQLTVDSTSNAAHISYYDTRGNFTGQKVTYSASTIAKTATAATATVFFAIYGSATKTIRVQKIIVTSTVASTAIYGDIICYKRAAAITGGTKTDLVQVPMDSTSGAGTASIIGLYTVAPTAGTGGGVIATEQALVPVTAGVAVTAAKVVFDWTVRDEAEAPVLRGIAQGLELSFATSPANIPTVTVTVVWVEE